MAEDVPARAAAFVLAVMRGVRPPRTGPPCRICGWPCGVGLPYEEVTTERWTLEILCKRVDSALVCEACAMAARAVPNGKAVRIQELIFPGEEMQTVAGLVATLRGVAPLRQGDRWRAILHPPEPPFVLIVCGAGDGRTMGWGKYPLLNAVVSGGRDPAAGLVYGRSVVWSPGRFRRILREEGTEDWGRLVRLPYPYGWIAKSICGKGSGPEAELLEEEVDAWWP